MQYALVIYTEPGAEESRSDADRAQARASFQALAADPRYVGGAQLQPAEMATCVRVNRGRTLMTDGPFADTKEVLGGFVLIEAADLNGAIEMAANIPAAQYGVVEVRPVVAR